MPFQQIVFFLIMFLLPGLIIIVFSRKIVEYNARHYPRIYGPRGRKIILWGLYVAGIYWIVRGFIDFILKPK